MGLALYLDDAGVTGGTKTDPIPAHRGLKSPKGKESRGIRAVMREFRRLWELRGGNWPRSKVREGFLEKGMS